MHCWRWLKPVLAIGFLIGSSFGYCADQPQLTVGVLPTFNVDTDDFGSVFSQHLALTLFQKLRSADVHALLLNPGGRYDPDDTDWLTDYGKKGAANFLVVTKLLKTERPEKGDYTIAVQTEFVDLKTGNRTGPWKSTEGISKRNARLDYLGHATLFGGYDFGSSRVFEKQPLGKSMFAIADQIYSQVREAMRKDNLWIKEKQTMDAPSGSCDIRLKILYTSRHAASKSYTLFLDGEDKGMEAKDGMLLLRQKFGTMLLQWSVNDAYYKLPKQDFYQANADVDCSKPERELDIEIGAAGEALLVWR